MRNSCLDTAETFQIIVAIAAELEIRPARFDWDVQSGDGGTWFGRNIPFGLRQ